MNCVAESMLPMAAVEVKSLSNGQTDVWLRRDMQGPIERMGEDGIASQVYTANEAYMRINRAMTQGEAEADFETLWPEAVEYRPGADKQPTPAEQWQTDTDAALVELASVLDELTGGM